MRARMGMQPAMEIARRTGRRRAARGRRACELEKRNLEKARSSEGPKRGAKSERRVSFAAIERSPGERVRGFAYGRARILDRWLTEIRRGLASIMCTCCIFHGTPPSSALAQ